MEVYSDWYFRVNTKNKDGLSELDYLKQLYKQTGEKPQDLDPPVKFPMLVSHIWSAFCILSDQRNVGMSGYLPLTFEQIYSYTRLMKTVLKPRDIEAILRLDKVYMKHLYTRKEGDV